MKSKINFDNPEKLCRLCLEERIPSKMKNLFQSKILNMINCCFHFKVVSEDHYSPFLICYFCLQSVAKFYNFKRKVQKNDKLLRAHVNKTKRRSILDIALNEAEISDGHSETIPIIQLKSQGVDESHCNIIDYKFIEKDCCSRNYSNYEKKDTRQTGKFEKKNESETKQKFEEDTNAIEDNCTIGKERKSNGINVNSNIEITLQERNTDNLEANFRNMTDGPPPLIPLLPVKVKDRITNRIDEEEEVESFALNTKNDIEILQNNLICNICKKSFKEREKLIGHLKGHMVIKDHACKICGKKYPNPSTFRIHMRSHTGERPFLCPVCNKGFTRWAGVISHMPTHEDVRPFKCETCGKTFKISSNLERHKVLHSEILPFCCNYCGKTFSQSDNLQLHIRTHHTNEKPYLCSQCGKRFVSSARLNRHMWVHTNYKPFKCSFCSKAYSNSSDLKNHQHIVHGNGSVEKPFPCKFCEMRFFHPSRLSKHLETHKKPYACDQCNKTFKTNVLFEKHVASKHSCE